MDSQWSRLKRLVESHSNQWQLAVTKDDKLRIIDDVGRVICEIPIKILEKFGGPAAPEMIRKGVPKWIGWND
jgi:hypothetical protein